MEGLTPKEIVQKLDEFIIGQEEAKKAVAIALRNRVRRLALGEDPIQEEIHPKNIIMMGPTGVGKTEIARRLAKLVKAPFIKVEATKYTEVGYVGRDVESMVRDLLNYALKMVRAEHEKKVREKAEKAAEERIINILVSGEDKETEEDKDLLDNLLSSIAGKKKDQEEEPQQEEDMEYVRKIFRTKLANGDLEDREIKINVPASKGLSMHIMAFPGMEDIESQMQNALGDLFPKKKAEKKVPIREARKLLIEEEMEKLLDFDAIKEEAIERTEQNGIIFIDEIDKIAARASKGGPDVSREGVQRDILPLVEGTTVNTRHGQVRTDHILFIAAGAFHVASVSDLIPELQGRFPLRVQLKALTKNDFMEILTRPKNALTKQYKALLSTENIALEFTTDGIERIAEVAVEMNSKHENTGARRLHTILEKVLEHVSFYSDEFAGKEVTVDRKYVDDQLKDVLQDNDLSRYIL
ncbi:MAG: ATP-dependent protease ATPase subunit HslU [Candidatus Hydrogenedentota bacterium]|nr:MAG: ATP-dependent protease ATPase subunit HslU [Candidatus Hydrogenedentota bacterium]